MILRDIQLILWAQARDQVVGWIDEPSRQMVEVTEAPPRESQTIKDA